MLPPESQTVASNKFAAVFANKSESYKLFWFSGILKAVSEGKSVISFDEIINSMICDAWYMVSEYHLNLGPTDTLEKLVIQALPQSGLKPSAGEKEILSFITTSSSEIIASYKRTLSIMVPKLFWMRKKQLAKTVILIDISRWCTYTLLHHGNWLLTRRFQAISQIAPLS